MLPRRGSRSGGQPDRPRLPDAPFDFKASSEYATNHVTSAFFGASYWASVLTVLTLPACVIVFFA